MRKLNRSDIRNLIESQSRLDEVPQVVAAAGLGAAALTGAAGMAVAEVIGFSAFAWLSFGTVIAGLLSAGGGAIWWLTRDSDEQQRIVDTINDLGLHEAFAIYSALKGPGTKTKVVRQMLGAKSAVEMQVDYAKVLVILEDTEDGGLIEWLMDDGMDDEAEELLLRMTRDQ